MLVGGVVASLLIVILIYICFKRCKKCREFAEKLKRKVFWNVVIRYSLEKSITIAIGSMAAIKLMNFDDINEGFSTVSSMVLVFALLNMAFGYPAFLNRHKDSLEE